LSLVKEGQSAVSIFYIVGKAEKQAKRWKLKEGQSAVSMFQMPVFLTDTYYTM